MYIHVYVSFIELIMNAKIIWKKDGGNKKWGKNIYVTYTYIRITSLKNLQI